MARPGIGPRYFAWRVARFAKCGADTPEMLGFDKGFQKTASLSIRFVEN